MAASPKSPEPAIKVAIGDLVLERYRVIERIGSGGHSVVFRGTDERLSRPVCIKVFSGLGTSSGVSRTSYEHFVQEAFALSRLTHPNTLRIYDFGHLGGNDAEGMPLQVSEYMNGGTLSQMIRERGKQPIAETARVISAMCAALSEAHMLGIVHRDIKPQNILFGTVSGVRLPKLADFGIAKWSSDASELDAMVADDTAIVAGQKLAMYSPSWAAPEQLAGQPVSAATDIYSLALVAVYMLSGRAIFADEDVYAGYKRRRKFEDHVKDALAPLKVPRSVIGVLSKAIAFEPKARLASIEELASELAATIDVASEPPPSIKITEPTEVLGEAPRPSGTFSLTIDPGTFGPTAPPPAPSGFSPASPSSPQPDVSVPSPASPAPAPSTAKAETPRPSNSLRSDRGSSPHQPGRSPTALTFSAGELSHSSRSESASPEPVADAAPTVRSVPNATPSPPMATRAPPPQYTPVPVHTPAPAPLPWGDGMPQWGGQLQPRVLQPLDGFQPICNRQVMFLHVPNAVAELAGNQAKVRATFISGPGGGRVIHIKGLSCFVAPIGGRPSGAITLDRPQDVALVTPRAQAMGHMRVTTGAPRDGHFVFALGSDLVAISAEDCTDPVLFDFGPDSKAYFVYTWGRAAHKMRPR